MKDPSYKAALSPPSHFCPHVVRKVLSYCFVYLVRKKKKMQQRGQTLCNYFFCKNQQLVSNSFSYGCPNSSGKELLYWNRR